MTDSNDEEKNSSIQIQHVNFEDLDETSETDERAKMEDVSSRDILSFANHILLAIAIIFGVSCLLYMIEPFLANWFEIENAGAAKEVFEFCKQTLPPIVTLILGTYFTSSSNSK